MPEWYSLGVVALVIVLVVVAIVRFRFNPVLALAVGAAAIGLLTGLGPVDTVSTMTRGFGEVMTEAGLLIGIPYALGLSFATYLQTIFVDALIVIAAPLALAGLLGVPLGVMMLGGFAVVAPTVVATILLMSLAFRLGFWDPARDEQLAVRSPRAPASPAVRPDAPRAAADCCAGGADGGGHRGARAAKLPRPVRPRRPQVGDGRRFSRLRPRARRHPPPLPLTRHLAEGAGRARQNGSG